MKQFLCHVEFCVKACAVLRSALADAHPVGVATLRPRAFGARCASPRRDILAKGVLIALFSGAVHGEPEAITDFAPPADGYDWIQLVSGEWLKGEIIAIYDEELRFDSDVLDELDLDWEDVSRLYGNGQFGIGIQGMGVLVGEFQVEVDRVIVVIDGQAYDYPRWRLVSLTHAAEREIDRWSGEIGFGFNVRQGNADIIEYNMNAELERRTARSRLTADYLGNVNETDGETVTNSHRASLSYDVYRGGRVFWRPVRGQYFRDPIQNIARQGTVETGLGYRILRGERIEWEVSAGLGVNYLRYDSVAPGEPRSEDSPTATLETEFDYEITSWMDYELEFQMTFLNDDSGAYQHHLLTTLSSDILGNLDFDVSFVWDRTEKPQQRADGTTPEKDDYRLLVGVSLDF